jgi:surface protein
MANWNTANVNSMINCFRDATSFNQNIGSWNTANVANMSNCFRNATAFNQDISSWNTANVSSFEIAFRDAKAFNQNLGSWNLRAAGVNCQQFFRDIDDMSTANYTDTLVGMINNAVDNGNLPINVNFTRQDGNTFDRARSGGSNFANAGLARDFAINTLNWDITSDTVIN